MWYIRCKVYFLCGCEKSCQIYMSCLYFFRECSRVGSCWEEEAVCPPRYLWECAARPLLRRAGWWGKEQRTTTETTSVVDPEWFILDPDPAKNFWSSGSGSNSFYLSLIQNFYTIDPNSYYEEHSYLTFSGEKVELQVVPYRCGWSNPNLAIISCWSPPWQNWRFPPFCWCWTFFTAASSEEILEYSVIVFILVAIVTASTEGIGLAIAKKLAADGAKVMISSRKVIFSFFYHHLNFSSSSVAEPKLFVSGSTFPPYFGSGPSHRFIAT